MADWSRGLLPGLLLAGGASLIEVLRSVDEDKIVEDSNKFDDFDVADVDVDLLRRRRAEIGLGGVAVVVLAVVMDYGDVVAGSLGALDKGMGVPVRFQGVAKNVLRLA